MKNKQVSLTFFQKLERLQPIELLGLAKILKVSLCVQAPPTTHKGEELQTEQPKQIEVNFKATERAPVENSHNPNEENEFSDTGRDPAKNHQNAPELRPAEEIISDLVAAYEKLNRTQKRNFNKILNALAQRGNEIIKEDE